MRKRKEFQSPVSPEVFNPPGWPYTHTCLLSSYYTLLAESSNARPPFLRIAVAFHPQSRDLVRASSRTPRARAVDSKVVVNANLVAYAVCSTFPNLSHTPSSCLSRCAGASAVSPLPGTPASGNPNPHPSSLAGRLTVPAESGSAQLV